MQITINLPDKLTEKIPNNWGNLSQKIIANLVLDAFKDGLIDFNEMKDILHFFSDRELQEFLQQKNMLHSHGIINLYGACPDLDIIDDLGICDDMDDDMIAVFDE